MSKAINFFLDGAKIVLDPFGNLMTGNGTMTKLKNIEISTPKDDAINIKKDWDALKQDFHNAIESMAHNGETKCNG